MPKFRMYAWKISAIPIATAFLNNPTPTMQLAPWTLENGDGFLPTIPNPKSGGTLIKRYVQLLISQKAFPCFLFD